MSEPTPEPEAAPFNPFENGFPIEDLTESGLLWLINSVCFHPQGLALVATDDDGKPGWTLAHSGPDEPFLFADTPYIHERYRQAHRTMGIAKAFWHSLQAGMSYEEAMEMVTGAPRPPTAEATWPKREISIDEQGDVEMTLGGHRATMKRMHSDFFLLRCGSCPGHPYVTSGSDEDCQRRWTAHLKRDHGVTL